MNKIPREHIEFLEFISNKIYSESPGWWPLDLIAEEYKKETSINLSIEKVRQIAALYKNKFFKTSPKSDLQIFPIPEIKQEIENHKSFKKYIKELQSLSSKKTNINNIINRLTKNLIIQIMGIIVIIYTFLKIIETIFKINIPYV